MKNTIIRIIGLTSLVFGLGTLYTVISGIVNTIQTLKFLPQINSITLAWIAIYGGYQALKARELELGRKMLIVWLSGQLAMMVFMVLITIFYSLAYPESKVELWFSNQNLTIAYLVFCVPVLIALVILKSGNDINDSTQIKTVGKLLSIFSPGLGRMLTGNFWLGIGLFILYSVLITTIIKPTINGVEFSSPIIDFMYGLIVWGIFALLDWHTVTSYDNSKSENLKADSAQVNGG
jgi:hypothetical protein